MTNFNLPGELAKLGPANPSYKKKQVSQLGTSLSQFGTSAQFGKVPNGNVTWLHQKDFDNGTVILRNPGTYALAEDIIFNPMESNDFWPTNIKPDQPFTLGFFSAIAIEGDNITLDLNQHTIRQSLKHYIQQRFFACIELASSPFIPGQGPADFCKKLESCRNLLIRNGYLGLSSHHSIHGNSANGVKLENLTMYDFEIAGVSLNGCKNLVISDCTINNNYKNVKVSAKYSHARFLLRFFNQFLKTNSSAFLTVNGVDIKAETIRDDLEKEMDKTYHEILDGEHVSSDLFRNYSSLSDGCVYGIVVNTKGVAVNDYRTKYDGSGGNTDIVILNTKIQNIVSKPREVQVMSTTTDDSGKICDPHEGMIRFNEIIDSNGAYKPNNLTNAQFLIAKYLPKAGHSHIPQIVLDWASGINPTGLDHLHIINDRDSMAHHMKGVIGLFISSATNIKVENMVIDNVKNMGGHGMSNQGCPNHYYGSSAYGITIASAKGVYIKDTTINSVHSKEGVAAGLSLIGELKDVIVNLDSVSDIVTNCDYTNLEHNNPQPVSKNIIADHLTAENTKIFIQNVLVDHN